MVQIDILTYKFLLFNLLIFFFSLLLILKIFWVAAKICSENFFFFKSCLFFNSTLKAAGFFNALQADEAVVLSKGLDE